MTPYVVRDASGQALSYVYYESGPGRETAYHPRGRSLQRFTQFANLARGIIRE